MNIKAKRGLQVAVLSGGMLALGAGAASAVDGAAGPLNVDGLLGTLQSAVPSQDGIAPPNSGIVPVPDIAGLPVTGSPLPNDRDLPVNATPLPSAPPNQSTEVRADPAKELQGLAEQLGVPAVSGGVEELDGGSALGLRDDAEMLRQIEDDMTGQPRPLGFPGSRSLPGPIG